MKKSIIRLAIGAAALCAGGSLSAQSADNVAYQDSEVRFTVITDGVIRLEWQKDGHFTDEASLIAVNREYPQTEFKVKKNGRKVEITTAKMSLEYRLGTGKFTDKNLSIRSTDALATEFVWKPGMKQQENLKGTFRTLDGLDGTLQTQDWVSDMKKGQNRELEEGLLAKDGWTLIDESSNYLFDGAEDWNWVKERDAKNCQDWYFMAYGHDYKAALKDFTVFAGKIPLPPRYAFGYWWSRYWAYSDKELRSLVSKFRTYDIPLDVLVVDMDWHYTDAGRGGWTGWTWNEAMFPNPEKFMGWLDDNGLQVTINLHPADGLEHYEKRYPELARSLGIDPASKKKVDWVNSDKAFMTKAFEHVFHPMQKEGVDFWWLDWQQHVYDTRLTKLHNTWWINYCFFSDMEMNGEKRPLLYHRWGGLGNHRYQIGFSGDAVITWNSLDFQPYFTTTASNVLYGYWSHDIGGHMDGGFGIDPELNIRWHQFGAVSPIMRTHSTKSNKLNKEPWVFEEKYADILRQTVRQRYEMAPYIYTMAREAYETGLSLCRPLYYDYPEAAEAYAYRNEYMFGENMLIAPITQPGKDGYTEIDVWLPEGEWYELHTGTLLKGGAVLKRQFALDEYGIYVKAGSVLPFFGDDIDNLSGSGEALTVTVFPGGEGSFRMYEDAGNDKNYVTEYATVDMSASWNGNTQKIVIAPRQGSYKDMPACREYKVKVVGTVAPESVRVNGAEASYEYIGDEFAVLVDLGEASCEAEKVVELDFPDTDTVLADGLAAYSRRVGRSIENAKFKEGLSSTIDALAKLGTVNEAASYNPEKVRELADEFMENYRRLPEILKEQKLNDEQIEWFLKDCGWKL